MNTQPRGRACPCQSCGWTTWNTNAICDHCTHRRLAARARLAALVPHPTQITETVWGERLPADSCTVAETQAAYEAWLSGASRYGGES